MMNIPTSAPQFAQVPRQQIPPQQGPSVTLPQQQPQPGRAGAPPPPPHSGQRVQPNGQGNTQYGVPVRNQWEAEGFAREVQE